MVRGHDAAAAARRLALNPAGAHKACHSASGLREFMLRFFRRPGWRPLFAGLSGSFAHTLLMYAKSRSGILPSFQPYQQLQITLGHWIGSDIHPLVPWAMSYLNGSIVVGFAFARLYPRLPGSSGAAKGLLFGVVGWALMMLVFFPLLGMGLFAARLGLGIWPAVFSLAMFLTYSIVMGIVYVALIPGSAPARNPD